MVALTDEAATALLASALASPDKWGTVSAPGEVAPVRGARGAASPGESDPPRGRGRRLPETLAALAERDQLIRYARAHFWSDLSDREAAREIAAGIARYASTAWVRERIADQVPTRHAGRPAAIWWVLLSVRDHVPSPETVRRAIRSRDFS